MAHLMYFQKLYLIAWYVAVASEAKYREAHRHRSRANDEGNLPLTPKMSTREETMLRPARTIAKHTTTLSMKSSMIK